jgi:membrane protein GlpM
MLFLKALLGALVVVLLDFLSRSKKFYAFSGLIPLFPTFTLIAHILVYTKQGVNGVKNMTIFAMYSLIPYLAYLISIYLFVDKFNFTIALFLALILWLIFAFLISYIYFK